MTSSEGYDKKYYLRNREKILQRRKEHYLNNKEKKRKYQLKNKEKIKQWLKEYYQTERYKGRKKVVDLNYRLKYPEKMMAREKIRAAIKTKKILFPQEYLCPCGEKAEEYHHIDYNKPLLVIPCCVQCHIKKIHKN